MALELTTIAAFEALYGTAYDDALVTSTIERAQAELSRICNRPYSEDGTVSGWLSASRTEYLHERLEDGIPLRYTPVTAITSLAIVTGATTSSAIQTTQLSVDHIPAASLSASASKIAGILRSYEHSSYDAAFDAGEDVGGRRLTWAPPAQVYKVVYTGGFASGSVPDDLEAACLAMTILMLRSSSRDEGLSSHTLGAHSYTMATGAEGDGLAGVMKLIGPYRRPTL